MIHGDSLQLALISARRLLQLIKPDGTFTYRYDYILRQQQPGYNILRHCGCVWALNLSEQVGELTVGEGVQRAMNWLAAKRMVPSRQAGLCVEEGGNTKLGGNALAILALVSRSDFSRRDRELIKGLCAHIWMQSREDGDFIHRRNIHTGEAEAFRSDYYTGEALFALLSAAYKLSDKHQAARAQNALLGLVATGYGISEQSHWMMYAVEVCHRHALNANLVSYAEQLVDNIISLPSYRAEHRCTPIACRTEALLAYLRMLPPGERRVQDRALRAWRTIEENLVLQLRDRLPDGAFRKGADSSEVRIDYLQHNLTALLGHSQLKEEFANPLS